MFSRLKGGSLFLVTVNAGTRVITDLTGKPIEIIGISTRPQSVTLTTGSKQLDYTIHPNQVISIAD